MEQTNPTQAPAKNTAAAPRTDAERYPLITNPTYRRCVEGVLAQINAEVIGKGGADNIKSCAVKQLIKAGNFNADFCLAHFAGIFDRNSPLSSAQRRLVKVILSEAARKYAELAGAAQQKAAEEEARNPEQEGGDNGQGAK